MGYRRNLTNPYLYRQFSNSAKEMFNYTMTNLMDSFYNSALSEASDGSFKAVCLSGIKTEDNTSGGTEKNDAQETLGYLSIVVRPLTGFGGIIPDPAGMKDPDVINSLIFLHSTAFTARSDFEAKSTDVPVFGQILNCYFEDGSISNSDFRGLRFSQPTGKDIDPEYEKLATIEGVVSPINQNWNSAFLLGDPIEIAPSSEEEIDQLAERFDKESTPNKTSNSSFISIAHPEFQKYIKAFIIKSADEDISIKLNSTYRNRAKQQSLISEYEVNYANWVAGGKQGKKPIKPAQYSYHISGLAFDFNPTLANGTTVKSSMSKEVWLRSSVVQLGESVGLRWGGYFSKNYDPIHFDFGKKVSTTRNKQIIAEASRKKVEATTIPIGV